MRGRNILVLVALLALGHAVPPSCIETNCTEPDFPESKGSNEPNADDIEFFNWVENQLKNRAENRFDDAIDPREAVKDVLPSHEPGTEVMTPEDAPQGLLLIRIRQFVMVPDEEKVEDQANLMPSMIFGEINKMFEEIGILDLSGTNMTGDELASLLSIHPVPVTSLVLSNSRITNLTPDSFSPVQDSLQMLKMDNCSLSLQALSQLSNLKFLNLSHNELSTFEWFPQMTDSLEVLDLSYNHFKEVRPELSILTSLKELYLSNNWLTSVAKKPLDQLSSSLEVLTLSMNSLEDANLSELSNLQEVDLDWNYLRLFGQDLILPAHHLSVRLASNPWRCDCGMLEARDSYDVLDLNLLQCANRLSYSVCNDCKRYFLPMEDGQQVSNLTVDSIEHLGCTGLSDQFYLIRKDLILMKEKEPEKLVRLAVLLVTVVLLLVAAVMMCRQICARKKFDNKAWLKIQEIPYLKISKLGKPQEVPYAKIDPTDIKI